MLEGRRHSARVPAVVAPVAAVIVAHLDVVVRRLAAGGHREVAVLERFLLLLDLAGDLAELARAHAEEEGDPADEEAGELRGERVALEPAGQRAGARAEDKGGVGRRVEAAPELVQEAARLGVADRDAGGEVGADGAVLADAVRVISRPETCPFVATGT